MFTCYSIIEEKFYTRRPLYYYYGLVTLKRTSATVTASARENNIVGHRSYRQYNLISILFYAPLRVIAVHCFTCTCGAR